MNEVLTSQEKLLLSTQMIQYSAGILNNLIGAFNDLDNVKGHASLRLEELIALHNEVFTKTYDVLEHLLNHLDGMDALTELDLNIINPILTAIQKTEGGTK